MKGRTYHGRLDDDSLSRAVREGVFGHEDVVELRRLRDISPSFVELVTGVRPQAPVLESPADPAPHGEGEPQRFERPSRRQRERIGDRVITKPPRADVLVYPGTKWSTVLVRRTHDVDAARELATAAWRAAGKAGDLTRHRIGWWSTTIGPSRPVKGAGYDEQHRVVRVCTEEAPNASPGVEWLADPSPVGGA